nr:immunoglobulin heavy chain junction region [Mus musculus]
CARGGQRYFDVW